MGWRANVPHLYNVSMERVKGSFKLLDLWAGEEDESVRFLPGLFNQTLKSTTAPGRLSLVHLDADSYESYYDALDALYPSLSPGAVVIIDWHLDGARRAVLEHRLLHQWDMPIMPVPVDYVYTCRQGERFGEAVPHTMPAKRVQSAFFVVGSSRLKSQTFFSDRELDGKMT